LGAALSADTVAWIKPELIVPCVDWYVKSIGCLVQVFLMLENIGFWFLRTRQAVWKLFWKIENDRL